MRRARAILARLLLVLMLGLVSAVAAAWSLAAWLPHAHLTKRFNLVGQPGPGRVGNAAPPQGQFISVFELSRRGMVRRAWRAGYLPPSGAPRLWQILSPDALTALGLRTSNQDRGWGSLPAALAHPTPTASGAEDARGWPFLCLWCTLDEPAIEGAARGPAVRGGLPLSRITPNSTTATFRALPLVPIWPGLLADSAIFAGGWAVLLPIGLALRRESRRRRGLCPACAYDLEHRMDAGCPECGWNRAPAPP